jgi:hypothetical protein
MIDNLKRGKSSGFHLHSVEAVNKRRIQRASNLNDNPATGATRSIEDDLCNIYPQMEGRPETSQIHHQTPKWQTRYQARQPCHA